MGLLAKIWAHLTAKLAALMASLALLTGCPQMGPPTHAVMPEEKPQPALAAPVPCALDGAAQLAPVCSVVVTRDEDGAAQWMLSRPDGGFVRLGWQGGQAVRLDGADAANAAVTSKVTGNTAEVLVGSDRYIVTLR